VVGDLCATAPEVTEGELRGAETRAGMRPWRGGCGGGWQL